MSDIRTTLSATGRRLLLHTPYDPGFVEEVKGLGGRWNPDKRVWSVDVRDGQRARALMRAYYGTDGSEEADAQGTVTVRVRLCDFEGVFRSDGDTASFGGRVIAKRPARDFSVRLGEGVVLVAGELPGSGGSMKYPQINAGDDVIVEVRDIPRLALERYDAAEYEVVGRDDGPPRDEAEQVRARRAELLDQISELDVLLRELDPEGEARRAEEEREKLTASIAARLEREFKRRSREELRDVILEGDERDRKRAAEESSQREDLRRKPLECRCGDHVCPPVGYTVKEYAKIAKVSAVTVSAWCKKGKVKAVRHRGRWYVTDPGPR